MKWKQPPRIKIYEALGALADRRVHVEGATAKVWSSSGDKYYDVIYEADTNSISSNDNGSYWQGYLGYPSIALLAALGVITCKPHIAEQLKGIAWKKINTDLKNDYVKVEAVVRDNLRGLDGFSEAELDEELSSIAEQISTLGLNKLHSPTKPPRGSKTG